MILLPSIAGFFLAPHDVMVVMFALVFGLGGTVLWVWALIDCGQQSGDEVGHQHRQLAWLVLIALTHVLGAVLYLVFGRPSLLLSRSAIPAPVPPTMARSVPAPPSVSPQPTNRPPKQCPKCGAPLGADAPEGLCPRCLLQMNLGAPTQFTGEPGAKFTASTPPPPPPVEEIAKHFPQLEILECLGRGGMGVVYKARQPRLNRLVALKILAPGRQQDPQFAERFLREAQALAKLNHPNIVTVYDFGESDGLFYLLMEYVDGVTLRGLLQGGKVESAQALVIVPRICEALQYAHEQGVVHRDIKPENVLLDKQGRVKIADFGIARMLGVEGLPAHTRDRYVIGTPYYMAPEQVEHPLEVDHRADIYSLGVVFYEMLTGELPLGRFALPSQKVQLDVRLDDVVLRTLEKEPERRYQQAGQVKTDVEHITGVGTGGVAKPGISLGAPPRPPTPPPVAPEGGGDPFINKVADFLIRPPVAPAGGAEPRFSGKAIAGVVWAALGFIALFFISNSNPPFLAAEKLLALMIILPCLAAPIGTTILGWAAVGDIRRSNGKIHGLWLAVFDGLLFPILAMDGLITLLCYLGTIAAWGSSESVPDRFKAAFAISSLVLSFLADGLIIGLAVRAVHGAMNGAPAKPINPAWGCLKALAVIFVIGLAVGLTGMATWIFSAHAANRSQLIAAAMQLANLDTQQTRLERAQRDLDKVKQQFDQGLATQADIINASEKVDVLQAQVAGDPVQIAQARLEWAQKRLANDEQLLQAGLIAEADYENAKADVNAKSVELSNLTGNPPTPTPAFGPIFERDLQAGVLLDLKNALVSFETGQIFSISDLPSLNLTFDQDDAWMDDHAVDASCIGLPTGYPILSGLLFTRQPHARFIPLSEEEAANLTATELPALWNKGQPQDYADYGGPEKLPGSFLFKTRAGRLGVVEIVARTDNPTGLKIRYKLLTSIPAAVQADNSPKPLVASVPVPPTPEVPTPPPVPAPPGYGTSPAVPVPPAYTPSRVDPDASIAMEIAAIEKLNFDNSKLSSFLNIARRNNLSPAAQVSLIKAAFTSLDFENSKITLLQEIVRNPAFSEQARTAILSRLGSLSFENNRVTILNLLNQRMGAAPVSSK